MTRIREANAALWSGNPYPFHYLPHLLGEPQALPERHSQYWVLLLRSGTRRVALQVDEVLGNQEVVVKNIGPQLARVIGVSGATVLGNGQVLLILNPVALASRPRTAIPVSPLPTLRHAASTGSVAATLPTVMIVDDSLTVRKISSRLLAREGYQVMTAKDGVDALEQLVAIVPDVLLVDIEMPRMDGFELTRNVRADERLRGVPIVMITSRTAEKAPVTTPSNWASITTWASLIRKRSCCAWWPHTSGSSEALDDRVALQGQLPGLLMVYQRCRRIASDTHSASNLLRQAHPPWRVDEAVGDGSQFRQVAANELAGGVKALRLQHWIEDPEIGCASQPLEAAHCQPPLLAARSKSFSWAAKISLTAPPVDTQILAQK